MIDRKKAATIISRVQIIRTWAAVSTPRDDIPRINNQACEKVVEWLDDALELFKEHETVVRCQDCKHFVPGYITDADDFIPCRCLDNHGVGWHPEDYCSYAEPKE